jgi:hypothetical protein
MRDPRDEDPGRELSDEELRAAERAADRPESESPETQSSEEVELGGRVALSDEIARRWDPRRLLRTISRTAGTGQPLDASTRTHFERRLGVDLGGVRIYTGTFAEQVTARHSAEAVTVGGTGMIFMSGTPDRSPATSAGRALLAHELTHVAQSARGLYRSAPGESAPLATKEHEEEAEREEAQEAAIASGAMNPKGLDYEKAQQELLEVVTARVLELVYDDERVHGLRNGDSRTRP